MAQSSAFLDPNSKPRNSRVFLGTIPYIRAIPVMETGVDGDVTLEEAIKTATARTQRFFPSS